MNFATARVAPEKRVHPAPAVAFVAGGRKVNDEMTTRQVSDTVWAFLDRAGPLYASWAEERFRQEMFCNCLDCGMASPIEDLFWIACNLLCTTYYEPFNPDCSKQVEGGPLPAGVYCSPQYKVGPYRVDFFLHRIPSLKAQSIVPPVVVELDGHDFHDKDKKQRAYEKARDRYLVKEGFRVLHYTGSEIVADPFRPAHEALSLLNAVSTPVYNPADPLDQGE